MDEIEPVVRVGLVPAGLAIGALALPERLCLDARGAFLTPSETEARGRVAVAEDLIDATELAGETTERVELAGFDVAVVVGFEAVLLVGLEDVDDDKGALEVEEDSGALEVDEERGALDVDDDKVGFDAGAAPDLGGTIDVLRAGPVADAPTEDVLETEVALVGLEVGAPELTDFFSADVAEAALFAAFETAPAATFDTGAFFREPAPKVPELRIYIYTVKKMTKTALQHLPF